MNDEELDKINRDTMLKKGSVESLVREVFESGFRTGNHWEAGRITRPADLAESACDAFWSRLEQLVGGRPEPEIGAGKPIGDKDVRNGMRVKLIKCTDSGDPPEGTKGTVSIPDKDGIPGVYWDVDGDFNQYYKVNALEDISDVE